MRTTSDNLQLLYIAYFGRPSDPEGIAYWVSQNTDQKEFSRIIFAQPEFQESILKKPLREQVNSLYLNLFGRYGDNEGLNYWTAEIQKGNLDIATLGVDLIYAATLRKEQDYLILENKLNAANKWTSAVSSNPELKLGYGPVTSNPWIGGDELLAGKTYLTSVKINSLEETQLNLNKALVSVRASDKIIEITNPIFSGLTDKAKSLIDQRDIIMNTKDSGFKKISQSEWTRFKAVPNWDTTSMGYIHYYSFIKVEDNLSYGLTSNEEQVWRSILTELNSSSNLPITFRESINTGTANLVIMNDNKLGANNLGGTTMPLDEKRNSTGFWQIIKTNRDALTGISGGNENDFRNFYKYTAIHELGHALGLDHPFENILWPGFNLNDNPYTSGPAPNETVMTYNFNKSNLSYNFSSYDQEALEYIWGTDKKPNYNFSEPMQDLARESIIYQNHVIPVSLLAG